MFKIIIYFVLFLTFLASLDYVFPSDIANYQQYKFQGYGIELLLVPPDIRVHESKIGVLYGCDGYSDEEYEIVVPISPIDLNGYTYIQKTNNVIVFSSCHEA